MKSFKITIYHENCPDGNFCIYLLKNTKVNLGTVVKYTHKLYPFLKNILG